MVKLLEKWSRQPSLLNETYAFKVRGKPVERFQSTSSACSNIANPAGFAP